MSLDQQIVDALALRLADITEANGYRTDAGLYVDSDNRDANEDTDIFPRLTWSDAIEDVIEQGEAGGRSLETESPIADRTVNQLVFTVTGHARVDTFSPGDVARTLIADIKQGMIRDSDKRLGGLLIDPVRYLGRQIFWPDAGGKIVTVYVRFAANYLEQAGDPDAQLTR